MYNIPHIPILIDTNFAHIGMVVAIIYTPLKLDLCMCMHPGIYYMHALVWDNLEYGHELLWNKCFV